MLTVVHLVLCYLPNTYRPNIILKCSETKFWSEVCVKNERGHFVNKVLMMKITNIGNKDLLKEMEELLFKIIEKRKRAVDKL
jgi:hypothetical protein